MKKYIEVAILIAIALGFCYYSLYFFVFKDNNDINSTGQIGDTIAGLTAPIINLLSAVLIYLSFREQFIANKLQKEAFQSEFKISSSLKELEQIDDLLQIANAKIKNLKYEDYKTKCKGIETIIFFAELTLEKETEKIFEGIFTSIYSIVSILSFVVDKTRSFNFELSDERVVHEKLNNIYTTELDGLITRILEKFDDSKAEIASTEVRFLSHLIEISILKENIIFHRNDIYQFNYFIVNSIMAKYKDRVLKEQKEYEESKNFNNGL